MLGIYARTFMIATRTEAVDLPHAERRPVVPSARRWWWLRAPVSGAVRAGG